MEAYLFIGDTIGLSVLKNEVTKLNLVVVPR